MEYEKILKCPNCKTSSLVDIGNWDDDKVFKCMACRGWFRESYINGTNKDALCMKEVPIFGDSPKIKDERWY